MGRMLSHSAIFVDTRDELFRKRFFPISVEDHLNNSLYLDDWYPKYLYYNVSSGLNCCSDVPVAFHYIKKKKNFLQEYLIYHSHIFGLEKNLTEKLPRKITLDEIISASDAKSNAENFRDHFKYHEMDSSEKF